MLTDNTQLYHSAQLKKWLHFNKNYLSSFICCILGPNSYLILPGSNIHNSTANFISMIKLLSNYCQQLE